MSEKMHFLPSVVLANKLLLVRMPFSLQLRNALWKNSLVSLSNMGILLLMRYLRYAALSVLKVNVMTRLHLYEGVVKSGASS